MKFRYIAIPVAALACAITAPAQSEVRPGEDAYAHTAILKGDFTSAEQKLRLEQEASPETPEVLLNLAAVMLNQQRYAEARNLYRQVLTIEDVDLILANGQTERAHTIAFTGLSRMHQVHNDVIASVR